MLNEFNFVWCNLLRCPYEREWEKWLQTWPNTPICRPRTEATTYISTRWQGSTPTTSACKGRRRHQRDIKDWRSPSALKSSGFEVKVRWKRVTGSMNDSKIENRRRKGKQGGSVWQTWRIRELNVRKGRRISVTWWQRWYWGHTEVVSPELHEQMRMRSEERMSSFSF